MTTCLVAGICVGLELFHIVGGCCIVVVVGSWRLGRCSFVDGGLVQGLELELGHVGSCSFVEEQLDGGLELNDHHLGILGCSIFRHMNHHRIGLTCR
jgi:hypothetical protein